MQIKAIQNVTRHARIETLMEHYVIDNEKSSPYFQKIFAKVTK